MIGWMVNLLGWLFGWLLFWRWPALPAAAAATTGSAAGSAAASGAGSTADADYGETLSVIIPARNEAANLPRLLQSLQAQNCPPNEIICVDDGSTDQTATIAAAAGVRLMTASERPAGWIGKSWACHIGARQAQGSLLLFLDADVWLGHDAVHRLLAARRKAAAVLSVQPYHQVRRIYEYCSLFFNLVLLAANGLGWPWGCRPVGLFGPVILISRTEYESINGHQAARACVADDLALGQALLKNKCRLQLFAGDQDFRFQMYGDGFRALWQGWTKNFATGAARTPWIRLGLIAWWIMACTAAAFDLGAALVKVDGVANAGQGFAGWLPVIFPVVLYGLFAAQLILIARRAGNFRPAALVFYPLWLTVFLLIFLVSIYRKLTRRRVIWKGRPIKL